MAKSYYKFNFQPANWLLPRNPEQLDFAGSIMVISFAVDEANHQR